MKKTETGYVTRTLWRVRLENEQPDTVPLHICGDSLADVQRVFDLWNDMGYAIASVSRIGRVVAFKEWKVTGERQ